MGLYGLVVYNFCTQIQSCKEIGVECDNSVYKIEEK